MSEPPPSDPAGISPQLVVASHVYPSQVDVLPLPRRPLFPKTVMPLSVMEPEHVKIVEEALASQQRLVGLVLVRSDDDQSGPPQRGDDPQAVGSGIELHPYGVLGQILKVQAAEAGKPMQVLVGGLDRFEIMNVLSTKPRLRVDVFYHYEEKVKLTDELRAYAIAVINTIKELVRLNPLFKQELNLLIQQGSVEEPGRLADFAAYLTSATGAELQAVLEMLPLQERLERALELLRREVDISKLQSEIREQIEKRISKQQREYFLREQLKAIKRELGLEKDDREEEVQRYRERLVDKAIPEEAQKRIDEEIDKLATMERASPEYTVTRNYVDWLTDLPWGMVTDAEVSLDHAREVLDDSHYGLDDVKERIVEHIAAGILRGDFAGSILCLVGPPGVGKTSIGRAIAEALGRPFYRFSLGGMRDEAEIKGHRRTYIGALPGKFIQAVRTAGAADPVMMLDEIDKVGASYRGDPASALLEALDPEQNENFLDHYLDVRFDLSRVLFVCTANQLDTIPAPLLDRMELIRLGGYLAAEKLEIGLRHLVPRAREAHGVKAKQLRIGKPAMRAVIDGYARQPGVRTLEKQIRRIVRKSAVKLLDDPGARIAIKPEDLEELLGAPSFRDDDLSRGGQPGMVRGLAWTAMGGATLWIEAAAVRSASGGFKPTGQLGGVMVESSQIAYTQARRLCQEGDCATFFDQHFVHLHVPAGATPKDGPSAGITMALALVSLAQNRPVRAYHAMTGELNLSGHVMPVGGIREKVIAARRAKVRHVILPKANEGDFKRVPAHIREKITAHFVATFDEVIDLALR